VIVVYVAPSIIERDALLNELEDSGIEALGEIRDVSRKLANSTVDLAYEGYSALMGGFTISVAEADAVQAKKIIQDFLARIKISGDLPLEKSSLHKFYASSIYSVFLPAVFHASGIYYLVHGLKKGEKIRPIFFLGSILLFLLSGFVGVNLAIDLFKSLLK
jgi:hypothetical protein